MIGRTIDELHAGDVAELVHRVEPDDVAGFVDAVGDCHPANRSSTSAERPAPRSPPSHSNPGPGPRAP